MRTVVRCLGGAVPIAAVIVTGVVLRIVILCDRLTGGSSGAGSTVL